MTKEYYEIREIFSYESAIFLL